MIEITTNADAVAEALGDKAKRLDVGLERGVQRLAEIVQQAKVKKQGRTYARAIPLSQRTRRPLWRRSNNWLKDQSIESVGRFVRVVRTVGPSAIYEEPLANLNDGADGVNRTNDASSDGARTAEPQLETALMQEVKNALDD